MGRKRIFANADGAMGTPRVRLQFDFSETQLEKVDHLERNTVARTRTDVISRALEMQTYLVQLCLENKPLDLDNATLRALCGVPQALHPSAPTQPD